MRERIKGTLIALVLLGACRDATVEPSIRLRAAVVGTSEGYERTVLPKPLGVDFCKANRINNGGQIIGNCVAHSDPFLSTPVLWDDGMVYVLPCFGLGGLARGINDLGQIVGLCHRSVGTPVVLWDHGQRSSLDGLWVADGINDNGQIVGTMVQPGSVYGHAAVYSIGTSITDLGTLGGASSAAVAINANGEIVGYSWTSVDNLPHGALWANGVVTDLGPGSANAINDVGQVLGYEDASPSNPARAWLWENGTRTYLAELPGYHMMNVFGINDEELIVGGLDDATGHTVAVVWDHGMISVLPGGAGWATAINARGEIVGVSNDEAVLWKPVNNPPIASFTTSPSALEGAVVTFDASGSTDPDGDALTYGWDFGDGTTGSGVTLSHTYADEGTGTYSITLTVADPSGASATTTGEVTVTNVAPVLEALSGPTSPLALGTSVSLTSTFTDPGTLDTHGATVDWGDGTTSAASITETSGTGSLTDSHNYASPGVYEVSVTLTDDDGATATGFFRYVVVYDPVGGFATGAGWITSPAGACQLAACTDAAGKAKFGFVSRYQKGSTVPTGTTEFQFEAGGLQFTSESYQWFVVSGPQAQFKGTGTLNDVAGYGFLLTARDGDQLGGGGGDRFRIKIWDASGTIVYDNQMGDADNSEAATELGGGQIQIHR